LAWSWLFDPDLIADGALSAADHLRQRAATPVGRERGLEARRDGFHAAARVAFAGNPHHAIGADTQLRPGRLRQIEAIDEQIVAPFVLGDLTTAFAPRRDRTADIARDARRDRHAGVVEHLHRRFGARVARDAGEQSHHPKTVTPAKAAVAPLPGDAGFRRHDGILSGVTALDERRHRDGGVALAVGEAPIVIVPADDAS